jgi:hypothetical protein
MELVPPAPPGPPEPLYPARNRAVDDPREVCSVCRDEVWLTRDSDGAVLPCRWCLLGQERGVRLVRDRVRRVPDDEKSGERAAAIKELCQYPRSSVTPPPAPYAEGEFDADGIAQIAKLTARAEGNRWRGARR